MRGAAGGQGVAGLSALQRTHPQITRAPNQALPTPPNPGLREPQEGEEGGGAREGVQEEGEKGEVRHRARAEGAPAACHAVQCMR